MKQISLFGAGVALSCLAACTGRAVDLDQPSVPQDAGASPVTPDAFAAEGKVTDVWVDAARLYWVIFSDSTNKLQSCLKSDCSDTVITITTGLRVGSVAITGPHVYWISDFNLFSCPVTGCNGAPTRVVEDPALASSTISANGDYVYWASDFDIYRCLFSGCAATPEVVAAGEFGWQLAFGRDNAYWSNDQQLLSAPQNGSAPATVFGTADPGFFAPAVDETNVYWTNDNSVVSCGVAGCAGSAPRPLATGHASRNRLQVDRSGLYWLEGDGSGQESVNFCSLDGCGDTSMPLTPTAALSFAIDDDYVYWVEKDQGGLPSSKAIHRAQK